MVFHGYVDNNHKALGQGGLAKVDSSSIFACDFAAAQDLLPLSLSDIAEDGPILGLDS